MLRRPRLLIAALLGLSCWAPVAEAQPSPWVFAAEGASPEREALYAALRPRLWECVDPGSSVRTPSDWMRAELRLRLRYQRGALTGVRVSRQAEIPARVRTCMEAITAPAPRGATASGTWVQAFRLERGRAEAMVLGARGSASTVRPEVEQRSLTIQGSGATAATLRRLLSSRLRALETGYARALRERPNVAGVVEASFEITPAGTVAELEMEGGAPALHDVVRGVISRLRLTQRDGDPSATVRVTFAFSAR